MTDVHLRNNKSLYLLGLLLTFVTGSPGTVMNAQEKKTVFNKVLDLISAPSRELDPEAVYQRAPSWVFALSGDTRQFNISQRTDFTIMMQGPEGESPRQASLTSSLKGIVNGSAGFQAGYGNLTLGWTQSLGKKNDLRQKTFFFDYLGAGYAAQFQYFDYQRFMDYKMEVAQEGGDGYSIIEGKTEKPARLRSLIVDGFYSFNQRAFAYSAAYKGDKVQRRSSGSFMAGAKLIQGLVEMEPDENIVVWSGGVGRQTTTQIAFGGGYSYNIVPYHRQPDPTTGKGLRNMTVNLTAIPMVTLFNQFSSTVFVYEGGSEYAEKKSYMNGNLMVNYVARAGLIYSWDRYSVSASGSYDSYSYKGRTKILFYGSSDDHIRTSGSFGRWSATLRFSVRF